jgi:hypothetical protein
MEILLLEIIVYDKDKKENQRSIELFKNESSLYSWLKVFEDFNETKLNDLKYANDNNHPYIFESKEGWEAWYLLEKREVR